MKLTIVLVALCCSIAAVLAQDCTTWYETTTHNVEAFRNVKDYGAKGDGQTDDTAAFIQALTYARVNEDSTKQPLVLYIPAGTYVVSDSLPMYPYTHIIGNYQCRPTLKLKDNTPSFSGGKDLVLATFGDDEHTDNFYHQVHNINIDLGLGNPGAVGIRWAVAQGTSLRNITINVNSGDVGIFGENGGGGFIGDVEVIGGKVGIQLGGQQWALRSITIRDSQLMGFQVLWNWVFSIVDLNIANVNGPCVFFQNDAAQSITILDSSFSNCTVAVSTDTLQRAVLLDRVTATNVPQITPNLAGNPSGTVNVASWRQGKTYSNSQPVSDQFGDLPVVRPDQDVPTRARNTFGPTVFNVYDAGAKGDGINDDTAAIQKAINENQQVFFPYGVYLITSTVTLKSDTVLVGEAFSQLMASGSFFADESNPQPMLLTPDDLNGTVQLADLILATQSDLLGAQLLVWRVGVNSALWDVHYRMMYGAGLQLWITGSGAGYFENAWLWTADHNIDTGNNVTVNNLRGMLIDSQGPTYLYGTAVEHSTIYNYNFSGASNIYSFLTQTEIPYLINPVATVPLWIDNSENIFMYGSGYYTWFHGTNVTIGPTVIVNSKNVNLYANNVHNYNFNVQGDRSIKAEYGAGAFCSFFAADVPF